MVSITSAHQRNFRTQNPTLVSAFLPAKPQLLNSKHPVVSVPRWDTAHTIQFGYKSQWTNKHHRTALSAAICSGQTKQVMWSWERKTSSLPTLSILAVVLGEQRELKAILMRKMKITTTGSPHHLPVTPVRYWKKRQMYSNTEEHHSLFFLTLAHLHRFLWKLWWAVWPSAPALAKLNARLADTSPKFCHTDSCCGHCWATATHQYEQVHHTEEGRDLCQAAEGRSSPTTPLTKESLIAATAVLHKTQCCLMQSFWYQR